MQSKIYKILLILWLILMVTVSSIPELSVPKIDSLIELDKLAHLIEYFILTFFVFKAFQLQSLFSNKIWGLMIVIFPLLDELHQYPIPGRQFSLYDILADLLGVFAVVLLFSLFGKKKKT